MMKCVVVALLLGCLACEESLSPPEIMIDISPVYVGIRSISPDIGPLHFDLRLTNRGEQVLEIDSVIERGDQHCAFEFEGPDVNQLGQGESAFVRGWYRPQVVGEDQIALEIGSNSHIYSPLIVPVCGRGVEPDTEEEVADISCNVPPPDQPDCANEAE